MDNRRGQLLDIIKREFIGPDPINMEDCIQDNGEEILSSDPPKIRYIAGILFPQGATVEKSEVLKEDQMEVERDDEEAHEDTVEEPEVTSSGKKELLEELEDLINLSNAYKQSAISLTLTIEDGKSIFVEVNAGRYKGHTSKDEKTGRSKSRYFRYPVNWNNKGNPVDLPTLEDRRTYVDIFEKDELTGLRFNITYRDRVENKRLTVYTLTLENTKRFDDGILRDEDCFFQCGFRVKCEDGFSAMALNSRITFDDEDYESNKLLYRDVQTFAIGHGCSADWGNTEDQVKDIWTEIFPSYEIKPIVPSSIQGVSLSMYKMSDHGNLDEAMEELELLCSSYKGWIEDLKIKSVSLGKLTGTAKRHIENCETCHERMVDGVSLLRNNFMVRKAFMLMNRAMLLQQLHYNLPLLEWQNDSNNETILQEKYDVLPDIDDIATWYGNKERYGKWRPFQLAFILINLRSMAEKESMGRSEVDLIWFPTGGGKTEAYLGLSAYTIFIRRMMCKDDFGAAILMRYTLRLLTAQQYERAASLICACEKIRMEIPSEIGDKRITIGLWVGTTTTPNKMKDAVKAYEDLYQGKSEENPFIMLKCPWCGAQMGLVELKRKRKGKGDEKEDKGRKAEIRTVKGYRKVGGRNKEIIFQCGNIKCDFSVDTIPLPLLVVDEAIYSEPPTLLLGTVDKFAMLPFIPQAQRLFGIDNGIRIAAPDLIIQDELHLISGPLGSMVGHYETMIHELCVDRRNNTVLNPKIIASTATISRAKEQCHALFGCNRDRVFQFPPSGIDAGDSFFAIEDLDGPGRQYVGVFAPASSSAATTSIRLYASLLYAANALVVEDESMKDPYWTNLAYFNSLRELGQTATWVNADIDEYLHTIYKRRKEDIDKEEYKKRRYIYRYEELTSRIRSDKIPANLQSLGITYPQSDGEKRPFDICLATNMISVGVDVPRLGLMTVVGQPKTTSEYIQATSRIGRERKSPGIVFVIYSPGKPRDKSHYEQFRAFHAKIYSRVEPTSVTPFSAPLRQRALHAVLIGLIRLLNNEESNSNPRKFPSDVEFDRLFELIEERVSNIDEEELDNTRKHLDWIIERWKREYPQKYSAFEPGDAIPLMFASGSMREAEWEGKGFPTPTSMRNVDAGCEISPLSVHYSAREE